MILKSLMLDQFRNYETLKLEFHEGINLFYGENAQGKTNILEAVYLCGTTRSHRGSKDREMIRFGREEAHLRLELQKQEIPYRIDLHLREKKAKGIAVNGVPVRKAGEVMGIGSYIFFSPEDLNLIKTGPAMRRRFLDMELCQLDGTYLFHLTNYNKALMQRNQLLKDIGFHPEYLEMLDIWDVQLAVHGQQLIRLRGQFIEALAPIISRIHTHLSGGREVLSLSYEKSCEEDQLETLLAQSRERDLRSHITSFGPHRDDMCFLVKDMDLRKYGSQGQQRTAALSLKLAEIEIVKKKKGDAPVLLLDDVLSELDSSRQRYLLESIHDIQTLITGTGLDHFTTNRFPIDRIYYIENGTARCSQEL